MSTSLGTIPRNMLSSEIRIGPCFPLSVFFLLILAFSASAPSQDRPSDPGNPRRSETYINGVLGFNGDPQLASHSLYYFDNKTPDPAHPPHTYVTRPLGTLEDCNFLNKGRNDAIGTDVSQWTVGACHLRSIRSWGAGIRQGETLKMYCFGVGDCMARYWYLNFYGGIQDASGEGVRGDAIHVVEGLDDASGTVDRTYTGFGITKVKLSGNYASAGVGHYFVDKVSAKSSGAILSGSSSHGIAIVTTTAKFAVSKWMGDADLPTTFSAINLDAPKTNLFTFTTSMGESGLVTVGSHVCLASSVSSSGEELLVQSASVRGRRVTLGLANKRVVGGYTNVALGSCDAVDLVSTRLQTATGLMNPLMVVGYPSAHQMMVAWWGKGGFQNNFGNYLLPGTSCEVTVSQSGHKVSAMLGNIGRPNANYCNGGFYAQNTTATISGTDDFDGPVTPSYADSTNVRALTWTSESTKTTRAEKGTISLGNVPGTFTIYPMAIVGNVCDDNTTNPVSANNETYKQACLDGTIDLEDNSINIAAGDPWEIPHYNAIRSNGYFLNFRQDTMPFQTVPFAIVAGGAGIESTIMDIVNPTPDAYVGSGGRQQAPPSVITFRGPNGGFVNTYAPSFPDHAVIDINCATSRISFTGQDCANTPSFEVFRVRNRSKQMQIHYYPSSGDAMFEIFGGTLGFNTPIQVANLDPATRTTKAGALYYNSASQRLRVSDSSFTFHDIALRDDAVLKTGDTMKGPLLLAGNPTSPREAATKSYVDSRLEGKATDYWWSQDVSGCSAMRDSVGATCKGNIATQGTMSDSNWFLQCTASSPNLPALVVTDDGSRPTAPGASIHLFVLVSAVSDGSGTFTPRVDCHAHHN
ncbi:hypothetical protein [Terriglobus roseus]|nr:hypothetical protein [Terriglobus roseus]